MRVMRVSRMLRLLNKFKGLRALVQTISFSLPTLFNVATLLTLVYFMYAVLGCYLFYKINTGDYINDFFNFSNFGWAFLLVFVASTGESWNYTMFNYVWDVPYCIPGLSCGDGSWLAFAYFMSINVVCSIIFLNMFVLIVIQ